MSEAGMTHADAIGYLAGASQIPVRDMSKAMFLFLRAAARKAASAAGQYDRTFEGFRPALCSEIVPQSPALRAKIVSRKSP